VLSALAHLGGGPPDVGAAAFRRGMKQLGHTPEPPALLPLDQCGLLEIDAALAHLNTAAPLLKRGFLEACASVVAEDGLIRAEEAELLRAIADALDCPVPAFIQGV